MHTRVRVVCGRRGEVAGIRFVWAETPLLCRLLSNLIGRVTRMGKTGSNSGGAPSPRRPHLLLRVSSASACASACVRVRVGCLCVLCV